MPDKNPPPHRCCCLLISSSATPLATSASCQSRRHSVDGWLVGHQNGKPFPLQLISLESQTTPVEVQCPPPPRLSSSARSTFSSAPETHILQTLPQAKENFQLQQKVLTRPRQHKGREGRGSRLSRWARSSPPSSRPGSETSRSAPRCSCAEI